MKVLYYISRSNGKIVRVEEISEENYQKVISNPDIIYNYNTNDNNGRFVFKLDSAEEELPKDLIEYILKIAVGRKQLVLETILDSLEELKDSLDYLADDCNSLMDDIDKLLKGE